MPCAQAEAMPQCRGGNEGSDVDAEIVEDDDDRQREQSDAHQDADDRGRVPESRLAGAFANAAGDDRKDELARPDCALQGEGNDEEDIDQMLRARRRAGIGRDDVHRACDHEHDRRALKNAADDAAPTDAGFRIFAGDYPAANLAGNEHQANEAQSD